jgi:hypothetical protein
VSEKAFEMTVSMVLLSGILTSAFNVQMVAATDTIHIARASYRTLLKPEDLAEPLGEIFKDSAVDEVSIHSRKVQWFEALHARRRFDSFAGWGHFCHVL